MVPVIETTYEWDDFYECEREIQVLVNPVPNPTKIIFHGTVRR